MGQTVIVRQAVLLALDHRSSKPSQDIHVSVAYLGFAPHYSGGTAPVLHRSSLLSLLRHLSQLYAIVVLSIDFYLVLHFKLYSGHTVNSNFSIFWYICLLILKLLTILDTALFINNNEIYIKDSTQEIFL